MNTKNILSTTILALAGIVLSTVSAHAVSGTNFTGDGDLTIQFRGSGATAAKSYVLDLGSVDNFLPSSQSDGAVPAQGVYNTGSLVNLSAAGGPAAGLYADLQSVFGASLAGVSWSLSSQADGNTNLPKNALVISSPEATAGTAAPAIHNLSAANANSTAGYISQFQAAYAAAGANGATTATGEIQNSATFSPVGLDYAGSVSNGHVLNFPAASIENTFGSLTGTVNDIYLLDSDNNTQSGNNITTGNGVDLGGFGFSPTGALNFDSNVAGFPIAPVPEPASAGLIASAILGCASLVSRRRAARPVQA